MKHSVKSNIHQIKLGYSFSKLFRYTALLFLILGLTLLWEGELLSLLMIIVSLLFLLSKSVVTFYPNENYFTNGISFFSLEYKKKKKLHGYSRVSIIKKRLTRTIFGGRTMNAVQETNMYYEIYLVNPSMKKKILIHRYKDMKQAQEVANQIADSMHFEKSNNLLASDE